MRLLAEAAGIFAGDGTLYSTGKGSVLEVRGNSKELKYYQTRVKPIFENVLSCKLDIIERNCGGKKPLVGIRKCNKKVVEVFHDFLGFPIGKKSHKVKIPDRIFLSNDLDVIKSYIRGIFDTDGSVYLRKTGRKSYYSQPIIEISSVSKVHKKQLVKLLKKLGFNAWEEKQRIRFGGWGPVETFFKLIKPGNNVYNARWLNIMKFRKAEIA